jgi:hypothetical protein
MDIRLRNLAFTRWVYKVNYISPVFIGFRLENRNDYYSSLHADRYELALAIEIEPFKGINTKTKGADLYLRNCINLHHPKDETGLFYTKYENIYFGDIRYKTSANENKKVLVFFQIIFNQNKIIIDVFDDYYSKSIKERNDILEVHPWYIKKAPIKSAYKSFKTLMAFNKKPYAR